MVQRIPLKPRERFEILGRDKFTCRYCHLKAESIGLQVDHIWPVKYCGTNASENLVTACQECNSGKAGKLFIDYFDSCFQERKVRESIWNHILMFSVARFGDDTFIEFLIGSCINYESSAASMAYKIIDKRIVKDDFLCDLFEYARTEKDLHIEFFRKQWF